MLEPDDGKLSRPVLRGERERKLPDLLDDRKAYDGGDLSSIIAFYEETLRELGAIGASDTEKHESGWAWTGTYDGGKIISIDVTPVEGEAGYVITIEIEE